MRKASIQQVNSTVKYLSFERGPAIHENVSTFLHGSDICVLSFMLLKDVS